MATIQSFAQAHAALTGGKGPVAPTLSSNGGASSFSQARSMIIQNNQKTQPAPKPTLNVQQAVKSGGLTINSKPVQLQQQQTNFGDFAGQVFRGAVGAVGSILKPQQPTAPKLQPVNKVVNLPMGMKLSLTDASQPTQSARRPVTPQTVQQQKPVVDNQLATANKILNPIRNSQTYQQANDIMHDPFNIKNVGQILHDPKKFVIDVINTIPNDISKNYNEGAKSFNTPQNQKLLEGKGTPSQTVAAWLHVAASAANFAFSPISAIFDAANKIPAAGTVGKLITLPFTFAGEGSSVAAGKIVDYLPISQQAKNNLKPAVKEIGSLVGQLVAGGIMEIGGAKKADLVSKYGAKDAQTIIEQSQKIAKDRAIQPGTYAPSDLRNQVFQKEMHDTPVGKNIIKATIAADQQGKEVTVGAPSVHAFENNLSEYRQYGGHSDGTETENAALRDVSSLAGQPEVKTHTQAKVQKAISEGTVKQNDDGTITLYRGGDPSAHNGLVSAAYTKEAAQTFADNAGGVMHEFKVKPEDIKAFIGRSEAEVLVDKKAVTNSNTPHPFPKSVIKEPLLHGTPAKFDKFDLSRAGQSDKGFAGKGAYFTNDEGVARYFADKWTSKTYPTERKGNIIKAHLDMQNPIVIENSEKYNAYGELMKRLGAKSIDDVPNKLKEKGYDGVIIESFHPDGRPAHEYVVYNENQIKMLEEKNTRIKTENKPNETVETKNYNTKGEEIPKNKKVLTTKEVGAIRDVIEAKFKHIRETSSDSKGYGKGIDELYNDVLDKSKGDKVVLSALRTELNKEMYGMAGTGGNYKEAYATLKDIQKTDPEIGPLIDKIEGHIHDLDNKLLSTPDPAYQKPAFIKERPKTQQGNIGNQEPVGQGKVKNSAAFKRLVDHLETKSPEELAKLDKTELTYHQANIADQAEKALNFTEKDPQKAYRVAKGYENPPEGLLQHPVTMALADRALAEKNYSLWAELEKSGSLHLTRAGQESAMERGRYNDTSPHAFIRQLMRQRLARLGKITDTIKQGEAVVNESFKSAKTRAIKKIDAVTEGLQKELRQKQMKIRTAQNILDALTCK